jgi:hypothetical protein
MSNYIITTDFGAKDSLPSSNDSKVVRGSEFTTEFTSIQTAIATKADTAGDTFTGVVNFSADVAVNTNTLFVDVSEAKVGIGTASPARALHVSSGATNEVARFESTDTACLVEFKDSTGTASIETRNDFRFSAGGSERMRIDSSGKVGIGTSSPNESLVVKGGTYAANQSGGMALQMGDTSGSHWQSSFKIKSDGSGNVRTTLDASTGAIGGQSQEVISINTAGNVGIGTTSPDKLLHVKNGDVRIESNFPRLYFTDIGHNSDYSIINNNGKFSIYDDTNTTYRMFIDSSGDMTIGTTSKSSATTLKVENAAGYAPTLEFNQSGTGAASIAVPANENALQFNRFNGSSLEEAMRIDASGNVLVGKTSADNTTQGIRLLGSEGFASFVRDGAEPIVVNRLTSDGNLVEFRKDSSTTPVGTIGTVSGDIRIGGGDNNHAGIRFAASTKAVIPVKNTDGDLSDNTTDLGTSNSRFKDLHLSGSGYIPDVRSTGNQYLTHNTGNFLAIRNSSGAEAMRIDSSGNVLVGTIGATANAKLKVNGAVILNDSVIYTKNYHTLDTTGNVVAKATGGANGSSTTFIFTGQGGSGAPFHIVFSCINAGGQWSATRSEIAASASVDVVASTSGNDVLFTFKSKSGSQGYSPKVKIETNGSNFDTTYLA